MKRRMFTIGALSTLVSSWSTESRQPNAQKAKLDAQMTGVGNRVLILPSKNSVLFRTTFDVKLGQNPPVTLDEARQIAVVPGLQKFSIGVRIERDVLAALLGDHKPISLILGNGYDDTCTILKAYDTLEQLTILKGEISEFGLERLLSIPNLKKLMIPSGSLGSESIGKFLQKQDMPVELVIYEFKATQAWPK